MYQIRRKFENNGDHKSFGCIDCWECIAKVNYDWSWLVMIGELISMTNQCRYWKDGPSKIVIIHTDVMLEKHVALVWIGCKPFKNTNEECRRLKRINLQNIYFLRIWETFRNREIAFCKSKYQCIFLDNYTMYTWCLGIILYVPTNSSSAENGMSILRTTWKGKIRI